METILTTKEKSIVDFLTEIKVSTKNKMVLELKVSPITVTRALVKYGYYTSYNYNASYYTLKDIPKFNDYGIWTYTDIGFSKYPNINELIISIINQSDKGYTTNEMNQLLRTETKNLLSRLRKQGRLAKFYIGHQAVYSTIDLTRQSSQQQLREKQQLLQLEKEQKKHLEGGFLPEGIDVKTVLQVLLSMIRMPDASVASLSINLQAKNVTVTAEQIGNIIYFYGLEKKTVL
jgi:hypothetical protein